MLTAQETPKKKRGFFDKLNEKLDKINEKMDPGSTKAPPAGTKPAPAPASEAAAPPPTARGRSARRYNRTGTCTPMPYTKPVTPDPVLNLPPGWESAYYAWSPEPPEPARKFTLEDLGRTQSIRVVFPPRKGKQMGRVDRKERILEFRDPSPPFEAELTLQDGELFTGFCDPNGQYHDSGNTATRSDYAPRALSMDFQQFYKGGRFFVGEWPDFRCNSCFFLNQVFTLGTQDEKVVVMVDPEISKYYFIRIAPYASFLTTPASDNLCKLERDYGNCGPGTFQGFERVLEEGDSAMFPGMMTNRWYVLCGGSRCERRPLEDIAPKRQADVMNENRPRR